MTLVTLYTTLGCHLCDEAKHVAWPVLEHFNCRLVEVEIANDDELVEAYGIRIPVLKCSNLEGDIGWPFDQQQLADYLRGAL